ncbi:hypothetical protein C2S51_011685 [Perilla frutescens var. frutescens]|nr:hypothetical protein C2S51_011685 [Perilla frutescens var. frutescens]
MKLAISLSPLPWSPPPPPPPPRVNLALPLRLSRRFRASARDRVIDFGKYKGRMLGSLPSAYLKWVSKNLRAGDTEEWAKLADRVLDDPVYRDRLEWEAADKILSGNASTSTSGSGRSAVAELLEISERFGWDNEDKAGWSKIDFGLLGTSKGARIPRANNNNNNNVVKDDAKEEKNESGGGGVGRRGERRERVRRMRENTAMGRTPEGRESRDGDEERESSHPVPGSPFPGREALLKKALNQQRL